MKVETYAVLVECTVTMKVMDFVEIKKVKFKAYYRFKHY